MTQSTEPLQSGAREFPMLVEASAVAIRDPGPAQVVLDVKVGDGPTITQFPVVVLPVGQSRTFFHGDTDASGARTGLAIDALIGEANTRLKVTKHRGGEVVDTRELTFAILR